jgi:hypothetical protein
MNNEMMKVNSMLQSNSIDELALFVTENLPVIEFKLKHTFAGGVYAREMFAPKGSFMIGKVHLTEDPYALMSGAMNVYTPEGGMVTVCAPHNGITLSGVQKAGYVLEDTHWVNYHALTKAEEEALEDGISEDELVDMIESRIYEDLEPKRNGKTVYEIYQAKLKEGSLCQQ